MKLLVIEEEKDKQDGDAEKVEEEENKVEEEVPVDDRSDMEKFLVDTLGYKVRKVKQMQETHTVTTPAEFLDVVGVDPETSAAEKVMMNHVFIKKLESDLEEGETLPTTSECLICDKPEVDHWKYQGCRVCYMNTKDHKLYTLNGCGHQFCNECVKDNLV